MGNENVGNTLTSLRRVFCTVFRNASSFKLSTRHQLGWKTPRTNCISVINSASTSTCWQLWNAEKRHFLHSPAKRTVNFDHCIPSWERPICLSAFDRRPKTIHPKSFPLMIYSVRNSFSKMRKTIRNKINSTFYWWIIRAQSQTAWYRQNGRNLWKMKKHVRISPSSNL